MNETNYDEVGKRFLRMAKWVGLAGVIYGTFAIGKDIGRDEGIEAGKIDVKHAVVQEAWSFAYPEEGYVPFDHECEADLDEVNYHKLWYPLVSPHDLTVFVNGNCKYSSND